jgi:hypothetical protein
MLLLLLLMIMLLLLVLLLMLSLTMLVRGVVDLCRAQNVPSLLQKGGGQAGRPWQVYTEGGNRNRSNQRERKRDCLSNFLNEFNPPQTTYQVLAICIFCEFDEQIRFPCISNWRRVDAPFFFLLRGVLNPPRIVYSKESTLDDSPYRL